MGSTTDANGQGSNEPAGIAAALEGEITRVVGVTGSRVVVDLNGRISEIHVLSTPERTPKQLVRDIQSVALARLGLEVDYRKISVVQLDSTEPTGTHAEGREDTAQSISGEGRLALAKITSELTGGTVSITVHLTGFGQTHQGTMRGVAKDQFRMSVAATLDAVREMVNLDFELLASELFETGVTRAAIVAVRVAGPRLRQEVVGSALVRSEPIDAFARATLNAVNRFFPGSS